MSNTFFNIFPNENFIDLCMYQFGYEQCDPGHSCLLYTSDAADE